MPVKIRLKRMGMKGRPFYRIVVANSASKRDGAAIEQVGYYDPMTDPATLKVDSEKVLRWLDCGAQPTDSAAQLLRRDGVLEQHEKAKAERKAARAGAPK